MRKIEEGGDRLPSSREFSITKQDLPLAGRMQGSRILCSWNLFSLFHFLIFFMFISLLKNPMPLFDWMPLWAIHSKEGLNDKGEQVD
jgi:hypothetical protein